MKNNLQNRHGFNLCSELITSDSELSDQEQSSTQVMIEER
jgi:hypothetical protein